jgi:hypothetical protein
MFEFLTTVITNIKAIDVLGLAAGAFVVATFAMKSMFWLRLLAILSNVTFMSYGILLDLVPIWLLHATLLPLNCCRCVQIVKNRWKDTPLLSTASEAIDNE